MASALRQGSSYRLDPYTDTDFQFGRPVVTRPWKKVALAIGLLVAGTVLLSVGLGLYLTGHKASSELAMVILGSLCFIPGSYHTYIAWKAWYRVDGYDLNQIPDW